LNDRRIDHAALAQHQEALAAGLPTFASVLGVSEGHLFRLLG
jgi:hypothetical protein